MNEDVYTQEQEILTKAIEEFNPRNIICLFSGGYDSMIVSHLAYRLDTHGLPLHVRSIDTQLSADGWKDFVWSVAKRFNWAFDVYDNKKGFNQFRELVKLKGCPRTRAMHTYVYQKLKERGIEAIHMEMKESRFDKNLFLSGMRRAESVQRANADEYARKSDKSNIVFCSPIVHWSNEACDLYRIEHELPDNPFYDTVKGSGDCQCNWGDFITLRTLQKYSPKLAAGNVALLDKISRKNHGYGWDGSLEGQLELLPEDFKGEAELTTPFLCQNCSRTKTRVPRETIEQRLLQQGELF